MSKIKKQFDNEWKVVGTNQSDEIVVNNPKLCDQPELLDNILEQHQTDITTLKKNVAWLALHGGGGSGGSGSGGGISEATCTILVNDNITGSDVILSADGITIKLVDMTQVTGRWNINIRVGSVTIYTTTASLSDNFINVSYDRFEGQLKDYKGNLIVTASYENDTEGLYGSESWEGKIIEGSVSISTAKEHSINVNNLLTSGITYTHSAGLIGEYVLSFVVTNTDTSNIIHAYSKNITITDTSTQASTINLKDIFNADDDLGSFIGVFNVRAKLTYSENLDIYAINDCSVILASDTILISAPTLSSDNEFPTIIDTLGSLALSFTAHLVNAIAYSYKCFVINSQGTYEVMSGEGTFGKQVNNIISLHGKSWVVISETSILKIEVSHGDETVEKSFYIEFSSTQQNYLSDKNLNKLIIDFSAKYYNTGEHYFILKNSEYFVDSFSGISEIEATMQVHDSNNLSVITRDSNGCPYLRISNGSYVQIDNLKNNNSATSIRNLCKEHEFSISVVFKADYHPDDERTVLSIGTNDKEVAVTSGIDINVHDIKINNSEKVKLIDNTLNFVDIVCESAIISGSSTNIVKIYIDGVLTSVSQISPNINPITYLSDYLGDISIGKYKGAEITNLCDLNIYSLKIYSIALSEFEILSNYLNNIIDTTYVNSVPNFAIMEELLAQNGCYKNDGYLASSFYTNGYNINTLLNAKGVLDINDEDRKNAFKSISIPVMQIVSSSWTFDEYIQRYISTGSGEGSTLPPDTNATIYYYDPEGISDSIAKINGVTIELQGTSTLADAVKNINITLPQTADKSTVFIPKSTWLPERTYTLKADVVDSSHSNNASIGTFINEVLGEKDNPFFSYSPDAVTNFNNSYIKEQQPTATLKHTVEGFPILLIMKFVAKSGSESSITDTPLGIYSFNLGRDAYRNLGFSSVKAIKNEFGEKPVISSFPFILENAVIEETLPDKTYWIEIDDTTTITEDDLQLLEDGGSLVDINTGNCDFWQNDDTILNERYQVKYPSGTITSNVDKFKSMITHIMRLPVEGTYKTAKNSVTCNEITGEIALYKYETSGEQSGNYIRTGETHTISTVANDYPTDMGINFDSVYKYFTIALLFGLVDNFGKNSTYRCWNDSQFYLDFYDMDTALGGDNQGNLNVSPALWIKYLYNKNFENNDFGYLYESRIFKDDTVSVVSAPHSKLWMSADTYTAKSAIGYDNPSLSMYTQTWYALRTHLHNKAVLNGYSDFVEYFIDKFYLKQMRNCGPFWFNMDYKYKYLLQFGNTEDYSNVNALSKLHGRKQAYTKFWLEQHINFLDSLFKWRSSTVQITGFPTNVLSQSSNTVYTTPESFPMISNSSIIISNSIADETTYYYFPKNVETHIDMGNKSNSDTSPINWIFSHSPNIIKFGNDAVKLTDINLGRFSYSDTGILKGYPSITELDLQNWKNRSSSNDILKPLSTASISELRNLDLSNTTGEPIELNFAYVNEDAQVMTKFIKLQNINISNSKIVQYMSLPAIPLKSLTVSNSNITSLTIADQHYISNVNVAGCQRLSRYEIQNCSNFTNVQIASLTELSECNISSCHNITEVVIDNCKKLNAVFIELCDSVQKIKITNCPELETISIKNCKNLQELDLSNTNISGVSTSKLNILNIDSSSAQNVYILNLYKTRIYQREAGNDILDLSDFTSLSNSNANFNIANNSAVKYIQFPNIKESPVNLTQTFNGCTNLERVYGHINLANSNARFEGCSKFKIHGGYFAGEDVTSNGIYRMPHEIVNVALADSVDIFNEGTNVTNIKISTTSLTKTFYKTAIDQFDVYYILSRATNVERLSETFCYMPKVFVCTDDVDNSPHRDMFANCTNVTYIYDLFRYTTEIGYYKIFSPIYDDAGELISNGLFTPMSQLATLRWLSGKYWCDRNVFKKLTNLRNISFFTPKLIVDNINEFSFIDMTNTSSLIGYLFDNIDKTGNLCDVFIDQPNALQISGVFRNTLYIDYNTTLQSDKLFDGVVAQASFTSEYAVGEFNLNKAISTNITQILNSFVCGPWSNLSTQAENLGIDLPEQPIMYIHQNTFSGYNKLTHIGYTYSGDFVATLPTEYSFGGFNKIITANDFENLLPTTLVVCAGLFKDAEMADVDEVELPGKLFTNLSQLTNVSGMFYNFNTLYSLTSGGFTNCPNLQIVSYLFGQDDGRTDASNKAIFNLTGQIPAKLFYHGSINTTITKWGMTESQYQALELDEFGQIIWPKINEENVSAGIISKYTLEYDKHNANISDMQYCFRRCAAENYVCLNPISEINPDYIPEEWAYIYNGSSWNNRDGSAFEKTIIWTYDGQTIPDGNEAEILDEYENIIITRTPPPYEGQIARASTTYYCCAPDLFRYCENKSSLNINGVFANSGANGHNPNFADGLNQFFEGLSGRICPYLLKPVGNVLSISNLFKNCSNISPSYKDNATYTIPEEFFMYAPKITNLSYSFAGMYFHTNNNLSVFGNLKTGATLDISFLCHKAFFYGTEGSKCVIGTLFTNKIIENCTHAFACITGGYSTHNSTTNQYVIFDKVFAGTKSILANTPATGYATDSYVFAGYDKTAEFVLDDKLPIGNNNYPEWVNE